MIRGKYKDTSALVHWLLSQQTHRCNLFIKYSNKDTSNRSCVQWAEQRICMSIKSFQNYLLLLLNSYRLSIFLWRTLFHYFLCFLILKNDRYQLDRMMLLLRTCFIKHHFTRPPLILPLSSKTTQTYCNIHITVRVSPWTFSFASCASLDRPEAALWGSLLRIQALFLEDGCADCVGIGLRHNSQSRNLIHVWKSRPVTLTWSCACRTRDAETVRLSLGGHPTRVPTAISQAWGKRCQWWTPPAHLLCFSALSLGERQRKECAKRY